MNRPTRPQISSRKQPKQARSASLVAAILEAAIQVLERDGAARFTTARVAEKAGVSVGSVYQYFPNKAAILFRLQADEWQQTTGMLVAILSDRTVPPLQRLRQLVHAFLRSECAEATMRTALADAAPLYRDAPEAQQIRASAEQTIQSYIEEVLPHAGPQRRVLVRDLVKTTLGAVGKEFSATPRSEDEIVQFADAMADMLCALICQPEQWWGKAPPLP